MSSNMSELRVWPFLFVCLLALSGCASIPKDAFKLSPTSMEDRQIQSRKFSTLDNKLLLSSGASVLQDMGYSMTSLM